jgi:outer membrane lipoprotein SlyB
MSGDAWRLRLLHAVVGWAVLLLVACEHGPPAVEHGTVLAAFPANQAAENMGTAAVAGVVIGGTVGGLIGGQNGAAALGTAIGIVAGGVAGSAAEGVAQPTDGVSYTVRIDDGRVVTVVQHLNVNETILPPGSRVRITTEGRFQQVTPDPA